MGRRGGGREGWVAVPREWFASVERGDLSAEQLGIAVLLAGEAVYGERSEVLAADGQRYVVGVGETLLGRRSFGERYHLGRGGRDRVTRALGRGEALGIWSAEAAKGAPPPEPPPAPRCAPPPAPPPTLVRFKRDKAILFPAAEPAPPPAPPLDPPPAPPPAPIQQGNLEPPNTSKPAPPSAPPGRGAKRKGEKDPDPRHRPLQERLEATFLKAQGTRYGFQPKDAKAIVELLRLSAGNLDEVDRRWRRALAAGSRWPGTSSIAGLASRWNELAGAEGIRRGMAPPSTKWPEEDREVRFDTSPLWQAVCDAHDALPVEERWNALLGMHGVDDGAGGLLITVRESGLGDLNASPRAAWISKLAGGVPVRFKGVGGRRAIER